MKGTTKEKGEKKSEGILEIRDKHLCYSKCWRSFVKNDRVMLFKRRLTRFGLVLFSGPSCESNLHTNVLLVR